MTRILERCTDGVLDGVGDIGRGVDEVEVLAGGLGNHSRVVAVFFRPDAFAGAGVKLAEHIRRAGEGEGGKLAVVVDDVSDQLGITINELDDAGGKPSLEKDLVYQVACIDVCRRRLPEDNVTHERWCRHKVGANGSEIEG